MSVIIHPPEPGQASYYYAIPFERVAKLFGFRVDFNYSGHNQRAVVRDGFTWRIEVPDSDGFAPRGKWRRMALIVRLAWALAKLRFGIEGGRK